MAKSSEKPADRVFLVNTLLAGKQTLMAAAASASAKTLMCDDDRRRLEAAIRTVQDVQVNL